MSHRLPVAKRDHLINDRGPYRSLFVDASATITAGSGEVADGTLDKPFTTIQAAIDVLPAVAASASHDAVGTPIIVMSGLYTENPTFSGEGILILQARGIVLVTGNVSYTATANTNANNQMFLMAAPSVASALTITGTVNVTDSGSTFPIDVTLEGVTVTGAVTTTAMTGVFTLSTRDVVFTSTLNSSVGELLSTLNTVFTGALTLNQMTGDISYSTFLEAITVTLGPAAVSFISHCTFGAVAKAFTGPALSLQMDAASDASFTTNSWTLGGGATKAILDGPIAGADTTAIHDDTAGEIAAVAVKGVPIGADFLLIEDSAAANAKKHILINTLPAGAPAGAAGGDLNGTYPNPSVDDGADATAIHDDTASEISAITVKGTPIGADFLLIEDSAAANAKKHILISTLPPGAPSGTAGGDLNGTYPNPLVDDGADATAIHDNVAAEISAVAAKAIPVAADLLLIEDSAAANAKKSAQAGNLPLGGDLGGTLSAATVNDGADSTAIHDNVASEISAVAVKGTPIGADFLLIEDSAAANAKKHILISTLPSTTPTGAAGGDLNGTYPNPLVDDGADATAIHDNVASEISAVAVKAAPIGADFLLIEDSAAANAKKHVTIAGLRTSGVAATWSTTTGDMLLTSVLGSMVITANEAAADAIQINASAGGIVMTSTATTASWTHTANGAADDLTIAVAGAFDSSLILSSAGTGADALQITASAGGLILSSSAAILIDSQSATTGIDLDLGTDTSATQVAIRNNTGADLFVVRGDGATGFYGTAPAAQAADMVALTDSTGGTGNSTVVAMTAVGGSGATTTQEGEINDNFADLIGKVNAIRTALRGIGIMA